MDPISALSLACNIVDLVGDAIKCGETVLNIYSSVSGLQEAQATVEREAGRIKDVAIGLTVYQSQLTANAEIKKTADRIVTQCDALRVVLDHCRSKKKKSLLSAVNATARSMIKSGHIQRLQKELDFSRKELNTWIAVGTRYAICCGTA